MVERANRPSNISASPVTPQPTITVDDTSATAVLPTGESIKVLLHGATVVSWRCKDKEQLFLSEKAVLDGSKPVRGGIPIVFPVFGPPPKNGHPTSSLPQHGFARNSKWEFLGKSSSESGSLTKGGDDSIKLDFGLYSLNLAQDIRKLWPFDFGLVYSVTLSRDRLQTMLNVRNEGQEPFEFQTLLHSYFRVNDISKTAVTGLMGTTYVDKVLNASEHDETNVHVRISGEVDRVYKSLKQDTTTILEDGEPKLDITRDNLTDTVLWNPWREKAEAMSDFEPKEGFKNMICVEVGAVDGWQKLEPGDTYEAGQIIRALL